MHFIWQGGWIKKMRKAGFGKLLFWVSFLFGFSWRGLEAKLNKKGIDFRFSLYLVEDPKSDSCVRN
jgi:hypothetical protein